MTARNIPAPTWWSILSDGACLGHIVVRIPAHGKANYEALDADDESLGTFASKHEAARALSRLFLGEEAGNA